MDKSFCNAASEDLGLRTEEEKKALDEKTESLKGFLTFVQETLGQQIKEVRLSAELGSHPVALVPADGMSFEMEKYIFITLSLIISSSLSSSTSSFSLFTSFLSAFLKRPTIQVQSW